MFLRLDSDTSGSVQMSHQRCSDLMVPIAHGEISYDKVKPDMAGYLHLNKQGNMVQLKNKVSGWDFVWRQFAMRSADKTHLDCCRANVCTMYVMYEILLCMPP